MTDEYPITGEASARFERVRSAFAENFRAGNELGGSFALWIDGALEIDLFGGYTDRKKQNPWTEETIACVYSCGKAVLSIMIARGVSAGLLDYDQPVARYWPEFAAAGKDKLTVAQMLSHQGGLCGFPDEMDPADWLDASVICARLAAMAPLWEIPATSGYHPQTVGFIAGELIRRVSGQSVGTHLRRQSREKNLLAFCGLSQAEMTRASYMPKPPKAPDLGELSEFKKIAFLKPWSSAARVSRQDWSAAEIPASNMHTNARSLAELLYPLASGGSDTDGAQVLVPAVVEAATKERVHGQDLVLPFDLSWAAGLMRNVRGHFGPNQTALGHAGFGGSCVVVDPDNRMSIAYVMNKMSAHLVGDPRALKLIEAVYACL